MPSVGRSACKCSSRRRPLPRRSARARAAGVVRGAPLKAVVPAWRRRDRVELSQCGAGGLLKARATMRVSDTSGHGGDGGSGARCWLWLLLLALSSLSSYCLYPGGGSSTPARVRRGSIGIYPRYTVRLYGYYDYRIVGWRSRFGFQISPIVSPPLRLSRFIVYSPRRLIFRIRSASAERRGRGPRPEFAVRRSVPPHGPATRCGLPASRTSK